MKIALGDLAKDLVTGFSGICVARTTWLNGCVRVTIQPAGLDKDGKVQDTGTFDEPQCAVIESGKVSCGPRTTGGPIPTPTQHRGPSR